MKESQLPYLAVRKLLAHAVHSHRRTTLFSVGINQGQMLVRRICALASQDDPSSGGSINPG